MELDLYILDFEENAEKPINHFKFEMSKISTGRANPQIIKGIKINYYESLTALEELSHISIPEPQQLLIKPYDQTSTKDIYKALEKANLGVMPVDEGNQVRLTFPTLTTERRKELIKNLGKISEAAKVGVRNARQNVNKNIKADEELSEDEQKLYLDKIQKLVDEYIEKITLLTKEKESELMNK